MDEEIKVPEEGKQDEKQPEDPPKDDKDYLKIMARLDEMAKDIAELKARADEEGDDEEYEDITY